MNHACERQPIPRAGAAFTAVRHRDTVDEVGPYTVAVRHLSGPEIVGGQVVYAVVRATEEPSTEGRADLQRTAEKGVWRAKIPGQPRGTTLTYHFQLTTRAGKILRHPARQGTAYRFRVLAWRPLAVGPARDISNNELRIELRLEAASQPSGSLVWRQSGSPKELRVTLAPSRDTKESNVHTLEAFVPRLREGELADFYFEIQAGEGSVRRIPANAPALAYTIKKPLRSLKFLPVHEPQVLSLATSDSVRWIGFRKGGAWVQRADDSGRRWSFVEGVRSGVIRFVLSDNAAQRAYVGTDWGVTVVEEDGGSSLAVAAPSQTRLADELSISNRLGRDRRAGPGALSILDGTLLFQLQAKQLLEQPYPAAVFLTLRDGLLDEWKPPSDLPLVGLSTVATDEVDGCWLLGGFIPASGSELEPVILRRCGDATDHRVLNAFQVADEEVQPKRVIAISRDPRTGGLALALEVVISDGGGRKRGEFGVYRLDANLEGLAPIVSEMMAVGVEVTSLAADWASASVLVGTLGRGLIEVKGDVANPVNPGGGLPSDVTALELEAESGLVLLGTTHGAYELSSDRTRAMRIGPPDTGGLAADALPMDADSDTYRVLVSSYTGGLGLIESAGNRWQLVERWRPGEELPAGLFGEAQFTAGGGWSAIMHKEGLLQLKDGKATLLTPADGLHSENVLRVLSLRSGEVWVAFTPLPFGEASASLQILQDGRIKRTIEVGGRNVATIGRWVEVPERASVFAATRAGVIELKSDGTATRLSRTSSSSIARDPTTGAIGAIGSTTERWDGQRFRPVLFAVVHPRWPGEQFNPGSLIDIAINRYGIWYLLFPSGLLVLLDAKGEFLGLMDPEDGIPPTARRLLAHPATGEIFIGSNAEGVVVLAPDV